MVEEVRRKRVVKEKTTSEEYAQQVEESPVMEGIVKRESVKMEKLISTGSTLLDLAISGGRVKGGGVPGGIYTQWYGPSGMGKTAVISELAGSCQAREGHVHFLDPEGRFDRDYANYLGVNIDDEFYSQPKKVEEVFQFIRGWNPPDNKGINLLAIDSFAALTTEMELSDSDQYGMTRAKRISEGMRKTAIQIAENNWLIAFTNQVRTGPSGEFVPGGEAIAFYSTIIVRVAPFPTGKYITRKRKIQVKGKVVEEERRIGIRSKCTVKKNTVDDPFRDAPISIVFGYGIDDVRENLTYVKDYTGNTTYECLDGHTERSLDGAVEYVSDNPKLIADLKENVINIWESVENQFKTNRKKKVRI